MHRHLTTALAVAAAGGLALTTATAASAATRPDIKLKGPGTATAAHPDIKLKGPGTAAAVKRSADAGRFTSSEPLTDRHGNYCADGVVSNNGEYDRVGDREVSLTYGKITNGTGVAVRVTSIYLTRGSTVLTWVPVPGSGVLQPGQELTYGDGRDRHRGPLYAVAVTEGDRRETCRAVPVGTLYPRVG